MNIIPRMEFYLERICEMLSDDEHEKENRALTKQEVMEKYHLTEGPCSELFQCINSPAYKVGNVWRVDEDDFELWYIKYINDIKNELNKYIRKENTKRMIITEADKLSRILYGMDLDDYLRISSTDNQI